jgi:hypothetical protein
MTKRIHVAPEILESMLFGFDGRLPAMEIVRIHLGPDRNLVIDAKPTESFDGSPPEGPDLTVVLETCERCRGLSPLYLLDLTAQQETT